MNNFEKYIREKLLGQETALNTEDLWAAIERKRRRRRLLLWWQFGGAGVFLTAISIAVFFHVKNAGNQHIVSENKNQLNEKSSANFQNKKDFLALKSEVKLDKMSFSSVENQANTVLNSIEKKAIVNKKETKPNNTFYKNATIQNADNVYFTNENKDFDVKINETETNIISKKVIEKQEVMKDEKDMKNTFLVLPTIEKIAFSEIVSEQEKTLFFQKAITKSNVKMPYEMFFAVGGGFVKRTTTAQNKETFGSTKAIEFWSASATVQRTLPKQYFVSLGLQANRIINRLDWQGALVSNVKYPDSLRFIAVNSAGNAYIAKGDYKVIRTTERNVRQYQYLDNYNLTLGAGKQWSNRLFRYQIGADFSLGLNKVKGSNLDENGFLQSIENQKFITSLSVFGQVNIPLRNFNTLWLKANYWQSLTAIDDAKYKSIFFQMGFSRHF